MREGVNLHIHTWEDKGPHNELHNELHNEPFMWLRGKSYKKEYEDKINLYIFCL